MQIVTTSSHEFDNNDVYDDGRTFDGVLPEGGDLAISPFIDGSLVARSVVTTSPNQTTKTVLVAQTTAVHPNSETNNYYPNRTK